MLYSKLSAKGGCFLRIQAIYDSLKTAEKRLADYILTNPHEVVDSTVERLANQSGSSYATIIRFCKRAGYHGFKDFRANLAVDLDRGEFVTRIAGGYKIDFGEKIEIVAEKIFRSSIQTLNETREILNIKEIEKAISLLLQAKEIYFIGTGLSAVIAQYAFMRFFRVGFCCTWEADPTIYKLKIKTLKPPALLFAISSSGRSVNVVDAAKLARHNNLPVISLTDFALSPLSRTTTCNLYITARESTGR